MSLRSKILNALLGVAAVAVLATAPGALGQPAMPSSVLPTGGGQALIDTSDSVLLLLDHQSGLFQTVKDISVTELRNNTVMLAKLATLLKIPVHASCISCSDFHSFGRASSAEPAVYTD